MVGLGFMFLLLQVLSVLASASFKCDLPSGGGCVCFREEKGWNNTKIKYKPPNLTNKGLEYEIS